MSQPVIKVENLSKIYRIGEIGTGSIGQDVDRWFKTKILGKEDPFLKIGEQNDRATKGKSDLVYSLKDINFEVNQGDAVGIIGRNGAGKSTLLKILSRITSPTSGRVNIKGRVASLLEVGTGFHPELTGRENIYLNGTILGMRKHEIDRKLDEIIDFSGIERYIDTPVKRYSSGMYVRLAFAVAAHLESEILIVDEVLAVGDAEFQKKCLGKMGEVSKGEGRTVLFVSHNMGTIESICSKGILLNEGRVISISDDIKSLVFEYDARVKASANFLSWQNKSSEFSNEFVLPTKLYLEKDGNELQINRIRREDIIFIVIEFFTKKANVELEFSAIFSQNNFEMFTTQNNDCELEFWPKINEGFNKLRFPLPNNLLNIGEYKLEIKVYIHQVMGLIDDELSMPQINFEIYGKLSDSPSWQYPRKGPFAPIIPWTKIK
jgi:lipopolysaccharide transport system ATP-binding protein